MKLLLFQSYTVSLYLSHESKNYLTIMFCQKNSFEVDGGFFEFMSFSFPFPRAFVINGFKNGAACSHGS